MRPGFPWGLIICHPFTGQDEIFLENDFRVLVQV